MVVCITETKFNNNITNATLGIENYNIWRKARDAKHEAGVMIIKCNELQARQIHILMSNEVELIAV